MNLYIFNNINYVYFVINEIGRFRSSSKNSCFSFLVLGTQVRTFVMIIAYVIKCMLPYSVYKFKVFLDQTLKLRKFVNLKKKKRRTRTKKPDGN